MLATKLGGTQNNRVFAFFDIKTPRRVAEARFIEAKEKKKVEKKAKDAKAKVSTTPWGASTTGALGKEKEEEW